MSNDSPERTRAAVLGIFFLSGISGLIYQVIWVREFANVFGNTVHSASLVTGVFMAGLGAGGYVLGRAGDRRFRADPAQPLRMYARAELAIAALGLALALVLPRLGALSAAVSSYTPGAHGWFELSAGSHALRYLVAIALVAPSTLLMGGTLTLLIRFLVATDVHAATRRIGFLYGANTAGAATGALVTDFVLVPAFGVFGTQLVAVVINVGAGILAFALPLPEAPVSALPHAISVTIDVDAEQPHEARPRAELPATIVALVLTGFAAMGLEILWFRVLSGILGELRGVFSLLLAVILTGIWLGAVAGSSLHRRFGRPALLLLAAQCLLAVTTLALLGLLDHRAMARAHADSLRSAFITAPAWGRVLIELATTLRPIVIATFVPAFLMGMSFPLANANVQRTAHAVGGRAGLLYLATTAGNVLGCGLVGFLLLPALGTQASALLLASCAAASAVPLYLSSRPFHGDGEERTAGVIFAGFGGVAVIAIAGFAALPPDRMVRAGMPLATDDGTRRILTISEGLNETLAVVEQPGFVRQLYTNGHSMSSTHPKGQRYMRAFAHVPLLQIDAPERVLVICFGVGSTLNAASLHPSVKRLEIADLSRHVLEHARWFESTNHGVLGDPRVSVFVNDGRHHLTMQAESTYDLITLEPPPISFAGVSSLYSREFYELAKSRLRPGGYLTQWLPAYQVPEEAVRSAVRAFVDVFPESVLLSGDGNELILMGTRGASIQIDLDGIARRLRDRPLVREDLEHIDLDRPTELAGMFAADHATMVAATKDAPAVTDDRPVLEYGLRSHLRERRMPLDLFDVTHIDAWCPGCTAKVSGLADYLRVRGDVYRSEAFLVSGRERANALILAWTPPMRAAVAKSRYLQTFFGGPGAHARRAGMEHLREGRTEEAIGALRRAVFDDPSDAANYEWLGRAYVSAGHDDAAAFALERAVKLAPDDAVLRFVFARVLHDLGVAEGAIEQYGIGLVIDPLDTDARYDRAVLLQGAGKREEAEKDLALILEIDPTHPRANLVLCKRAAGKSDWERAERYCEAAGAGGAEVPADVREKVRDHQGSQER